MPPCAETNASKESQVKTEQLQTEQREPGEAEIVQASAQFSLLELSQRAKTRENERIKFRVQLREGKSA
jgi:hypothetical protein